MDNISILGHVEVIMLFLIFLIPALYKADGKSYKNLIIFKKL